jgi:hypothetical protein
MRLVLRMLLIVATISLSSVGARAEEGSHYFPGAVSSFTDMLPVNLGSETIGVADDSIYYHGSNNHLGLNATTYTNDLALLYQFPWAIKFLPGEPQYSVAFGVPYTWLKVNASVKVAKNTFVPVKNTDNGFGDVAMFPIMLGWSKIKCNGIGEAATLKYILRYQTQLGIYAPTGDFDQHSFARVGRNFWTFEPGAAVSFLRFRYRMIPGYPKIPLLFENTLSAGFDFNTKNNETHWQTGDQFHLDGTVAVHMPVDTVGSAVGVGVSGFFYQQITGDTGKGDPNGSNEAMTTGVGPDLSFISNLSQKLHIAADVKWLPELSVSNRLQGNAVWFKVAFSWGDQVSPANCEGNATFAAQAAPYSAVAPFAKPAPLSPAMRSLYAISSF